MILSVYIINKAGGLVYHQEYGADPALASPTSTAPTGHPRLSSNDYLVLAGTFHGIHAISSRINPAPTRSSGVEYLETDTFKLFCYQTLTGVKFLLTADPLHPNCHAVLKKIYILYADYVMKNPFHTMEMPIRCELFDNALAALVKRGG